MRKNEAGQWPIGNAANPKKKPDRKKKRHRSGEPIPSECVASDGPLILRNPGKEGKKIRSKTDEESGGRGVTNKKKGSQNLAWGPGRALYFNYQNHNFDSGRKGGEMRDFPKKKPQNLRNITNCFEWDRSGAGIWSKCGACR